MPVNGPPSTPTAGGQEVQSWEATTELLTKSVLAGLLQNLTEGATGIASGRPQDWCRSVGHGLQRVRSVGWFGAFLAEWNALREKGRISDEYVESRQHEECLQELLDALDDPGMDATRFDLLKKIFLAASRAGSSESLLPRQLMAVARGLNTGEVLVVFACSRLAKDTAWNEENKKYVNARVWMQLVADVSGLQIPELVETHEESLVAKKVIQGRSRSHDVMLFPTFRLTPLGSALCDYVHRYDEDQRGEGSPRESGV